MEAFLSFLYTTGTSFGLKLLYALIVLVVGLRLIRWLMRRMEKGLAFRKLDAGLQSFLRSFLRIVLYILLGLCLVGILDIPTTGFVTMLASCSVALGLALQGALGNFAGGLMLLFFKPFKVGDYVEASGCSGTVKAITVFYTVLSTVDNKTITLPNGSLTNAAVVNYSSEGIRRVDMTFSAAYDSDIDQVKKIILDEVLAHPLALTGPEAPDAPLARMSAQKDSCLEFTLRVWCRAENYWTLFFDLNENIKKAFDANQIEIPFPQLDIHTR